MRALAQARNIAHIRVIDGFGPADDGGACRINKLRIIVSWGGGWDHVSVSLPDRCPTWDEMDFVRRVWFDDSETVMQLHPPRTEHINCHPYCLHLWRPQTEHIPMPPGWMVGPKTKERAQ